MPGKDRIVVDFDLIYLGDADIQVGWGYEVVCISVQVSLLGVAAGVRDVRVEGRARLVLCPTIPHLPFVGGVQLFFLDRPRIQFSFQVISFSLIMSRYLKGGGQTGGQVARHPGEGGGGPAGRAEQGGGLAKQAHPATLLCSRSLAGE